MNHLDKLKSKWQRGELCFGSNTALTDAAVSELFGEVGYDLVWIDMEHSAMSTADALGHVRAARGAGAAAFIRVPSNDPVAVKPLLELHPAGVIVPRIASVADAEQAVVSCRYPPRGQRGFGPARGVRFGHIGGADYLDSVDEQMLVILQIEHIDAVNDIDAVLSVPGIDSVVTGPGDLSATMGLRGQGGHPDVVAAVKKVYEAAIARGIPAGHSAGYDPEGIRQWLNMGLSWLCVDGDWISLFKQAKRALDDMREIQKQQSR
jgi:2-keto-3-deoxy-L-rhamnonate aldolase RhmA